MKRYKVHKVHWEGEPHKVAAMGEHVIHAAEKEGLVHHHKKHHKR